MLEVTTGVIDCMVESSFAHVDNTRIRCKDIDLWLQSDFKVRIEFVVAHGVLPTSTISTIVMRSYVGRASQGG